MECNCCGQSIDFVANKISIWGMFDNHCFHKYTGSTVDEIINQWIEHISEPIPAIVGEREVDDLGPTSLCPAIVMAGNKELRRVGKMIFPDLKTKKPSYDDVEEYKKALLEDPDISRLLATTKGK